MFSQYLINENLEARRYLKEFQELIHGVNTLADNDTFYRKIRDCCPQLFPATKICIGGLTKHQELIEKNFDVEPQFVLETYYTFYKKQKINEADERFLFWCQNKDLFLLDSGGFSFMYGAQADFFKVKEDYINRYANFIIENHIKYYVELDLDAFFDLKTICKMRDTLETKTTIPCIPVWHRCRGIKNYIDLTKRYDFIGIGTITGIADDIFPLEPLLFSNRVNRNYFLELVFLKFIAWKNKCKLHGLGTTSPSYINHGVVPFDTVDSTTWLRCSLLKIHMIYKNNKIIRDDHPSKELYPRLKAENYRAFITMSNNYYKQKKEEERCI